MTLSFTNDDRGLAETYDRLSNAQFESGKRLVERLAVRAGEAVLDVGCGTGRLARWIAEIVGPTGAVVGIDPLPERVAIARSGAPSLRFDVGHAGDLAAFAPSSFDVVCMSAVFHWIEDKPRALAEARRVLRPGGRLGATTLPRELMSAGTMAKAFGSLLREAPFADRVDASRFAVARLCPATTEVITMLVEGGFELAELHVMPRVQSFATGEDLVDFIESSSFGNFVGSLPDDLRASFRGGLAAAVDARRTNGAFELRDWGLAFIATRA